MAKEDFDPIGASLVRTKDEDQSMLGQGISSLSCGLAKRLGRGAHW